MEINLLSQPFLLCRSSEGAGRPALLHLLVGRDAVVLFSLAEQTQAWWQLCCFTLSYAEGRRGASIFDQ